MSDTRPTPPVAGGNGRGGVITQAFDLSRSLVTTLPPAFLLLVLINVVFIGMLMWFLNSNQERRADMIDKLIDRCMSIALHAPPQ